MSRKFSHAQYREATGRTPVMTIMQRWWTFGGVPGVFLVLFFLVMGGWVVAVPIFLGWFGVTLIYPLAMRFVTNTVADACANGNPDYRAWRERGGDPYCDANGFPINFDPVSRRLHTPDPFPEEYVEEQPPTPPAAYQQVAFTTPRSRRNAPHQQPPDRSCPRCRCRWNMETYQCDSCYTFFDVDTQQYIMYEPDPRLFEQQSDPSIHRGRMPG